jgi:hypothetical protein
MAAPKNEEAAKTPADEAEKAAKPKTIRNKYHGPLQVSDGLIIPVGGSIAIDDMAALTQNRTVAAWLKAGVIEII